MFGPMAAKVFFDAFVLCIILYVVAKHEADYSFPKVAMVVAGTTLGNLIISVSVREFFPADKLVWILPLFELAFSTFMIVTFCWVSFWKSVLVVILFSVLHVAFSLAMGLLMSRVMASAGKTTTLVERQEQDIQEIKEEMARMAQREMGIAVPPAPETNAPVVAPSLPEAPEPPASPKVAASESPAPAGGEGDWAAARRQLKIGGTSERAGVYTALVNRQLVGTGDVVTVSYQGKSYRWVVRQIAAGKVSLEPFDIR